MNLYERAKNYFLNKRPIVVIAIFFGLIILGGTVATNLEAIMNLWERVTNSTSKAVNVSKGLNPKKEDITLLYLFEHDFGERLLSSQSEEVFTSQKDNTEVRIKVRTFFDFEAQNKFIAFYIPPNPNTFDLCMSLVDEYKNIFTSDEAIKVETSHPGLQPVSKSDLKFSGRVFIYHEYHLFEAQKRKIFDLYKEKGLSVQFRGTDYLWMRKQNS